jgi:hypothetical protein
MLAHHLNWPLYPTAKKLPHVGIIGVVDGFYGAIPLNFAAMEKNNAVGGAANGAVLVGDDYIRAATVAVLNVAN